MYRGRGLGLGLGVRGVGSIHGPWRRRQPRRELCFPPPRQTPAPLELFGGLSQKGVPPAFLLERKESSSFTKERGLVYIFSWPQSNRWGYSHPNSELFQRSYGWPRLS